MLRRLFTIRWILALLLTLVGAAVMVRLGMWQLGRGERRHSLQNYSYAVEWVLFAAFTVFVFVKLLRDDGTSEDSSEPAEPEPSVVVPQRPAVEEPADDELAAYNAYLARLNQQHTS